MIPSWSELDPDERAKWAVFIPCAALVLANLLLRAVSGKIGDGLDVVTLGLTVVGLSPWIARVVDNFKFGGLEFKFVRQLEQQGADIKALKFLLLSFISPFELDHLNKFANAKEFIIDKNFFPDDFRRDLRHLRDLGLIIHYPDRGIQTLYESPGQFADVLHHFKITDVGSEYLRMRAEMAKEKS